MNEPLKWNFPIASRDENMLWRSVAVYKDNIHIPLERYKNLNLQQTIVKPEKFLNTAASFGNYNLVRHLTDFNGDFKLQPSIYTLDAAVHSGHLDMVKYLLDPVNQFDLAPIQKTLDLAHQSKNAELIDYLANPNYEINILNHFKLT